MLVLGIESSCDETAAAVVGPAGVLSDIVHGQAIHVKYGGVVPEIASRAHAEQIVPTVMAALEGAGIARPDAVAATAGPGLIGAVLVGLCFGKAAAIGWGVPFVAVNHLEGHLLSPLLDHPDLTFPFLSLVVSGGHTTLYLAEGLGRYTVLAETVDDAAGECFDKVARMIGLGYPGGPHIDRLALTGDPAAVPLPRPRLPGLDMSFSGIKTAVRVWLEKHPGTPPPTSPPPSSAPSPASSSTASSAPPSRPASTASASAGASPPTRASAPPSSRAACSPSCPPAPAAPPTPR